MGSDAQTHAGLMLSQMHPMTSMNSPIMNQPCMPVPYSPFPPTQNLTISSEDIQKIAMAIKSVIQSDIKDMVAIEMQPLKDELNALKHENFKLRYQIDDLEQYGRRPLIRVSGIPETPGENTTVTTVKILQATVKAGIDLSVNDIKTSHRVGKQNPQKPAPRQIIVKLDNVNKKFELLKNSRQFKKHPDMANININEDLTKYRNRLAYYCRQLAKHRRLKKTWTTNGKSSFVTSVIKSMQIESNRICVSSVMYQ
jgi:hypothetical protein